MYQTKLDKMVTVIFFTQLQSAVTQYNDSRCCSRAPVTCATYLSNYCNVFFSKAK